MSSLIEILLQVQSLGYDLGLLPISMQLSTTFADSLVTNSLYLLIAKDLTRRAWKWIFALKSFHRAKVWSTLFSLFSINWFGFVKINHNFFLVIEKMRVAWVQKILGLIFFYLFQLLTTTLLHIKVFFGLLKGHNHWTMNIRVIIWQVIKVFIWHVLQSRV